MILFIYDRSVYTNPRRVKIEEEQINHANAGQVMNSIRFVYSNSDKFDIMEICLNRNPELKNPKRARMKIM